MSFAHPWGLALLGFVVPVVLLHVLRPRRAVATVSSTMLWRDLQQPVSAAAPWQRFRWSLLLLLQLLAVVLAAVAVADPVRLTPATLAEHTVFVVDASGSMAATDGVPDRLASAVAEAERLRDELPDGGVASIVVATDRPRVALTASDDRTAFSDALGTIETTTGSADFADAFALAQSLETSDAEIGFVLLSDGGLTRDEQRLQPPVPEDGVLDLNAKLKDVVPEIEFTNKWEATDPIRLVHLSEHTTGWDDIQFSEYRDFGPDVTPLEGLAANPVSRTSRWRPGRYASYCNSGPVALAAAIEKMTGEKYEDLVDERIFAPLGIEGASFLLTDDVKGRISKSYSSKLL